MQVLFNSSTCTLPCQEKYTIYCEKLFLAAQYMLKYAKRLLLQPFYGEKAAKRNMLTDH